jgi:hypothetical protein
MPKRAARARKNNGAENLINLNPDVTAGSRWNVHRAGQQALGINADKLEITDSGALIFIVESSDDAPPVVIAANAYLYCVKVA